MVLDFENKNKTLVLRRAQDCLGLVELKGTYFRTYSVPWKTEEKSGLSKISSERLDQQLSVEAIGRDVEGAQKEARHECRDEGLRAYSLNVESACIYWHRANRGRDSSFDVDVGLQA